MTLEIQYKIKNNQLYKQYLREHSYWYKYLTRNPMSIKGFEEEVKHYYKLTKADRFNKVLESMELIQSFMSALK